MLVSAKKLQCMLWYLAIQQQMLFFVLYTDASKNMTGAELSQMQDGIDRNIGYASKVLGSTRMKYCTTMKELQAIVFCTRHFRHYLLGRRFVIRTDHNSLIWLLNFRNIEGQLARWIVELAQYNMIIQHRSGINTSTLTDCSVFLKSQKPAKITNQDPVVQLIVKLSIWVYLTIG